MQIVGTVTFLWNPYIPQGMLTMVVGAPGVGKSLFVLLGIVKNLIDGTTFLDGSQIEGEQKRVIWFDSESSYAINLERMQAFDIPLEALVLPPGEDLENGSLEDEDFIAKLREQILDILPWLVVIDSLRGAHGLDENSSQVTHIMKALADLAQETGVAILVIHHLRKCEPGQPIGANDIRGSNAQAALARSIIAISKPFPFGEELQMEVIKSNVAKLAPPIGFRFDETEGIVGFDLPNREKPKSQLEIAASFLREWLADGELLSTEIEKLADAEGISGKTLQRAKATLGVVTRKKGTKWSCSLPKPSSE